MYDRGLRARRGFTLIELMVVISIIALLVIFLVVGFGGAGEHARLKAARALIEQLLDGCDRFKEAFGFYPPDHADRQLPETTFDPAGDPTQMLNVLEALGASDTNDFENRPELETSECLIFCLRLGRRGGPFVSLGQKQLADRDGPGDEVTLYMDNDGDFQYGPGDADLETVTLYEVVDPWGTALRFRSPTGREDDASGYDDGDDDDLQDLQNPKAVEIYSAGPNQVFGEDDGEDNDGDGDTDEPGELDDDDIASWQVVGG